MLEVLRLQLRQIAGGRLKWLVVLCLSLPVLLSLALRLGGALDEIRRDVGRERQRHALAAGDVPPTAERVRWSGQDLVLGGGSFALELTEHALRFRGEELDRDRVLVVNDGQYFVLDGELWFDPDVTPRWRGYSFSSLHRVRAGSAFDAREVFTTELFSTIFLFLLYPQAVCLLLALFYGTYVLGSELDGKTLTYLFVRPLPRWRFITGKFLGIVITLIPPTCVSLLASWLILGAEGGAALIGSLLLGAAGATVAFSAVFILIGFLVPRRAMIVALLYAGIFELVLSFVPALINEITVTYYLRSLVVEALGLEVPRELARIVGGASVPGALAALAAIVVVALGSASWLAAHREYVVKDRV